MPRSLVLLLMVIGASVLSAAPRLFLERGTTATEIPARPPVLPGTESEQSERRASPDKPFAFERAAAFVLHVAFYGERDALLMLDEGTRLLPSIDRYGDPADAERRAFAESIIEEMASSEARRAGITDINHVCRIARKEDGVDIGECNRQLEGGGGSDALLLRLGVEKDMAVSCASAFYWANEGLITDLAPYMPFAGPEYSEDAVRSILRHRPVTIPDVRTVAPYCGRIAPDIQE